MLVDLGHRDSRWSGRAGAVGRRRPRSWASTAPGCRWCGQAGLLGRLAADYADVLPELRDREPQATIILLLHAVCAHQAKRVFACDARWRETTSITEVPRDRAEDVSAALALLQTARDDLESALLLAARTASTLTGKPLLTFEQIAAAVGADSEQAAHGRYRRKVGTPNVSSSGIDGTP
ncbi:hypothetical protein [Streptomyces murinus]|uniref:hypothetical protein n=1 Tax=Streptomyces murinus TaxID=33900 RepID=UPI00381DCFA9